MSKSRREVEARGKDVESAIKTGLEKLGLSSANDVIVEVVDEGSRGLLGIGGREAVVRLTPMVPISESRPERPPAATKEKPEPAPVAKTEETAESANLREEEKEVALELVTTLLEKMQIEADVSSHLSKPDDLTGRQVTVIDVRGDDLGILIGPHGSTLNAMQYICRLMAGHRLRRRTDFVIDIEGYRQRREQALARLAERMAQKVAQRGRAISLEPMSPYERRIIHMTLRNDEMVYTQSVGEGKRRKVRIYPKSD